MSCAFSLGVDEDYKTTALIQGPASNYKSKTIVINESGLYALVLPPSLSESSSHVRT